MSTKNIFSKNIRIQGLLYLTALLNLALLFSLPVQAQDNAAQILAAMDKVLLAPRDKELNLEMVMTDLKTNKEKIKKAKIYQKGTDKKLFIYTYPQSDKGIATLSLPDELYIYLPMFKNPKKITNMAEGNSFNKSDFSLEDMPSKPYSKSFEPTLVSSDASAWVLALKPKEDKPTYSKLVVTVNKAHHYPEKIEYYDKKGTKIKEAVYHFRKIGNYWVSDKVTMTDLKKKHNTAITMTDIRLNQGLKDSIFTLEHLTNTGAAQKTEKKAEKKAARTEGKK
jgi:outer membrane lipoprotein-sorting protein